VPLIFFTLTFTDVDRFS